MRLTRIYTRGGDAGETSLGDGSRVSKLDARIEAFGAVDELNAALGVVLAGDVPDAIRPVLERVQNELFDLGADLSVPVGVEGRLRVDQTSGRPAREATATGFNAELPELTASCCRAGRARLPALHVARTICRRAERDTLRAAEEHELGPLVGRLPEPALGSPLHPRPRCQRARGDRRAALEAGRDTRLNASGRGRITEVFGAALRLGLTSFGGPVAHIGYFRAEYVDRRRWLGEQEFTELVAVTNLLPGPSSSQLGIAIGARRAGRSARRAAWLGFTLPSAVAMTVLALTVGATDVTGRGLGPGAGARRVPVVLVAVIAMAPVARSGCAAARARRGRCRSRHARRRLRRPGRSDRARSGGRSRSRSVRVHARAERRPVLRPAPSRSRPRLPRAARARCSSAFPSSRMRPTGTTRARRRRCSDRARSSSAAGMSCCRCSTRRSSSPAGSASRSSSPGTGSRRPCPGRCSRSPPIWARSRSPPPNGVAGAALALVAIFLPSFLLLGARAPGWSSFRHRGRVQAALVGVSAAVVGLLAAAFWNPVLTSSIDDVGDVAFAAALLVALPLLPVWTVVPLAAAAGQLVL